MKRFEEWQEPMAATLTYERFTGPEWLFERKLDGIRLIAYKRGRDVRLFSRNHLLQNDAYPSVAKAVADLPARELILDGEAAGGYHVFDILWLNGQPTTQLPLEERRALLRELPLEGVLKRVAELRDAEPWQRACREGWEGVIAKRRDAPYEHKRSKHWLKMKCECAQELVVGGFTDPRGARVGLGALLVGYYEEEDFVFAGKVGTGFDTRLLNELRAQLDALRIDTPPFTRGTGLPRLRVTWTQPQVVVQVAFLEWTKHGKLRHARLVGLRTDKQPRDVVREIPG